MSDSDENVDFDIHSPEDVQYNKRRGRAAAAASKNGQLKNGNKGKPLIPKNRKGKKNYNDDDDDDESVSSPTRPKNGRKRPSDPKWDDFDDFADGRLTLDSGVIYISLKDVFM